jgi:capsular exopolysaccharide synthesis family protein
MNDPPVNNLPAQPHHFLSVPRSAPPTLPYYTVNAGKAPDTFTIGFFWRALRQWWKLALPLGLLLAVGAGAVALFTFQPTFRATALLQIKEQPDYLAFRAEGNNRFVQNQVELLRSPVVLERVLATDVGKLPEVAKQTAQIEWLQRGLMAKNIGGSDLFELSFACPNAEGARTIVNTIVQSYLELSQLETEARTDKVIELLNTELERRRKEVDQTREKVRELAKKVTGKDPYATKRSEDTIVLHSPLAALQERLATTEVDREVVSAKLEVLKESLGGQPSEPPAELLDQMLDARAEIIKLKELIEADRFRITEVEKLSQPGYTQGATRARTQLASDEEQLTKLRETLSSQFVKQWTDAEAKRRKDALSEAKTQVSNLDATVELLKDRIKKLTEGQAEIGGNTVELEFTKGELERADAVYQRIADRILALTTEVRAPERVWIMRKATVPTEPEVKSPLKTVVLASLAAFSLPFVLAIGWEHRVRRISEPDQITSEASLPVVGEIATLPPRRRFPLTVNDSQTVGWSLSVFEESIDCLRTRLILSDEWKDLQVIAIVSAISQEGKTSLTAQLANSLARATGKSILMIDGDMRAPDLHELFGVPNDPGLVKVLSGACPPREAVKRTAVNPLVHLLPAGRATRNPHSLLGNGTLKALLAELRKDYEYIVIDTPPVLSASESLGMAKLADGVLVCTLCDSSRAAQLRITADRLLSAGAKLIGVVLSGVPTRSYAYKYGSYGYVAPKTG